MYYPDTSQVKNDIISQDISCHSSLHDVFLGLQTHINIRNPDGIQCLSLSVQEIARNFF